MAAAEETATIGTVVVFNGREGRFIFGFKPRKTLTRTDVVWCFANILGRHPRSAAEMDHVFESCDDLRDVVQTLVAAPEFVTRRTTSAEGFVYEDSDGVQQQVLDILRQLEPMQALEFRKIRIGKERDGGYVMLDDFDGMVAAYSIGISDEVSWDLGMVESGIEVLQSDHTIDAPPFMHPRLHWTKKGLGASVTADLETMPILLDMNGHRGRNDLILTCDIEGCEWEMLAAFPAGCLRHFKQTVLEVHFLERLVDPGYASLVGRAVAVLTAEHRVVNVHANNHRPYSIVGGIPLPSVLELTLARIQNVRLEKSDEVFPSALDTPCYPGRADYRLGSFRF